MAEAAGLSRNRYLHLEIGEVDHMEKEAADKLMAFYGVDETVLLDDYNRFLYAGQGSAILELRHQVRMGKKPFARATGIPIRCLQEWESERKQISRRSWKKYFEKFE